MNHRRPKKPTAEPELGLSSARFWLQSTLDAYEVRELSASQFARLLPEIRREASAPSQVESVDPALK